MCLEYGLPLVDVRESEKSLQFLELSEDQDSDVPDVALGLTGDVKEIDIVSL